MTSVAAVCQTRQAVATELCVVGDHGVTSLAAGSGRVIKCTCVLEHYQCCTTGECASCRGLRARADFTGTIVDVNIIGASGLHLALIVGDCGPVENEFSHDEEQAEQTAETRQSNSSILVTLW